MADEQVEFTLPSSPDDRKKIKDAIHEMAGALQFIEDKRAYMKDVADMLKNEFEMPKKIASKMARTVHKQNYLDVAQESSVFELFYENLFPNDASNASE